MTAPRLTSPPYGSRLLAGRLAGAMSASVLLALLTSPTAQAHTALVSSDPATGADVQTLPPQLQLTFSEELQPLGADAQLTGPSGPVASRLSLDGPRLVVAVPDTSAAAAGDYTLAYRVTSADGHPISGVLDFSTTTASQPTATPSGLETGRPADGAGTDDVGRSQMPVEPTQSGVASSDADPSALKSAAGSSEGDGDGDQTTLVGVGLGALALAAVAAWLWTRRGRREERS